MFADTNISNTITSYKVKTDKNKDVEHVIFETTLTAVIANRDQTDPRRFSRAIVRIETDQPCGCSRGNHYGAPLNWTMVQDFGSQTP